MRLAKASIVAGAAALIVWVIPAMPAARGQQDADKKVQEAESSTDDAVKATLNARKADQKTAGENLLAAQKTRDDLQARHAVLLAVLSGGADARAQGRASVSQASQACVERLAGVRLPITRRTFLAPFSRIFS